MKKLGPFSEYRQTKVGEEDAQKVLLLIYQSIHEEQLVDKTNAVYRPLTEANTDTGRIR